MKIEIIPAGEKYRSIVTNLARYYIYDFSPYIHQQSEWYRCQKGGNFNSGMGHYFKDPASSVFLIRVDGEWAGFAMVRAMQDDPDVDFNLAEFFITRPLRGKGIGRHVAHTLFDKFKGRWDLLVLPANEPAILFWEKVVAKYTRGTAQTTFSCEHRHRHDQRLCIHRFSSRKKPRKKR